VNYYLQQGVARSRYWFSSYFLGYPLEIRDHLPHAIGGKYTPDTKFVIFTSGRSGSTLLIDLLNTNPEVLCEGELLKRRVLFPERLLKGYEQKATKPIYGFKLLSYQLKNIQTGISDKKAFLHRLVKEEGYQLIYLHRTDHVRLALSIIYGFQRNKWHRQEGKNSMKVNPPFELKPDRFIFFLNELARLKEFEQEMLEGLSYLSINYENDLQKEAMHNQTISRIAQFLGIEEQPSFSNLRKTTPKKLAEMVTNRELLIEAVRNSEYEAYASALEEM